jgi:hypothetical protein
MAGSRRWNWSRAISSRSGSTPRGALSFAGVEYEILEHCLTEDQIAVYDAYAEAWAIIHANLREALEATRIVDQDSGDTLNSGAKSAALSIFEGTKQRFFAQLLLSMKLPSLLPAIETALANGNAVVVQLVSTAEAMLEPPPCRSVG